MEIPKAKIVIYTLTFIGYIYSGYGSNVLTNLRDAVIAAEGIFGDLMGKVGDVVQKIKNVHDTIDSSIEEVCTWSCPNGGKAVKNKYHKPVANGCGPAGLEVNIENLPSPEMTKCCNEHDICYSTCNTDKEKCDIDFRKCLYKICESIKVNTDDLANKGCKAAAKMLYTATTALGCSFYQSAQEEACFCQPPKKKKYAADEL
ncbi:hypothetical protein O3M35_009001 [Rhynocoris fuscipes]|uniref:Group XIIA secretory phospholipase A2 n=1 Tax=Rhynocoris fuscipes TaxID=488301 RepID=A0AAW1D299_9HEMI